MKDGDGRGTLDKATTDDERLPALLDQSDAEQFRDRWQSIQGTFVDEPKHSVEQADALVTEVIKRLTETFQQERQSLESQLDADEVSTEDLRVALQRYRSFFERLLETS
jgi:outer membrane PBP1 activator LpoA protein